MPNIRVDAAFRSSKHNECYVFVKNKYVLLRIVPGSTNDEILDGPRYIHDGFPMLANTPFEYGIDCAFDTDNDEAYIFYQNNCAQIDYAAHSKNGRLLTGPTTVVAMFPFLRGTPFENGIDAAIKSSRSKEVYIFKRDQYARINYESKHLLNTTSIGKGFRSLVGTIFEHGLDAAFAIHVKDEAYIFKGEHYVRLNFAPCANTDYIIGRTRLILDTWIVLRDILLSEN